MPPNDEEINDCQDRSRKPPGSGDRQTDIRRCTISGYQSNFGFGRGEEHDGEKSCCSGHQESKQQESRSQERQLFTLMTEANNDRVGARYADSEHCPRDRSKQYSLQKLRAHKPSHYCDEKKGWNYGCPEFAREFGRPLVHCSFGFQRVHPDTPG